MPSECVTRPSEAYVLYCGIRKLPFHDFSSVFLSCDDVHQYLCSHSGFLLLKWFIVGLGFDGAETNCRIAYILGTLLMISYRFDFYFSDIIVVCAV